MTRSQKVSYGLFGGVIVGIVAMHLGGPLLAGLFSYMILDYANQKLSRRMAKTLSRWFSLLIFLVIATGVVWLLVYFLRQTISTIPQIVTDATPAVIEIAQRHNVSLPFDSIQELREVIIGAIKGHAGEITKVSGLLSKRIFHILAGMFVAVLCFFADRDESYQANLFDAIRKDFNRRARGLMEGFEKVIGAQVIISLINTTATAIFLVVTGFPYIHFLVPATFIVGILPIIGNLISNTFIVATALTISPKLALAALVFLIVVHKAEYFLNSRIVGSSIRLPTWQTLVGILVGEIILGIPGLILAPAMIYYLREEMRAIPSQIGIPKELIGK